VRAVQLPITDNNGNVKSCVNTIGALAITDAFTYDPVNRLLSTTETSTSGGGWTEVNDYDRYGNRRVNLGGGSYSLSFNSSTNRIMGKTYDGAGNLTVDGAVSYGYDAENHMVSVNSVTGYKYDGEGRRVRKLTGENTRFIYGIGGELIAEFNGSSGALLREYVSGEGMMAVIEPGVGTRYTTADHLGSPRVVTNSSGGVVSRHDYKPFGEELFAATSGRLPGDGYGAADGVRKKFTGYERDNETGLDFAQARYFSSIQGRFTSADPIGGTASSPQTLNRYSYALNSPLVLTDPTGMYNVGGSGAADPFIPEYRIDGMLASGRASSALLGSGAAVEGPSSPQYDHSNGVFVHFGSINTSRGSASGWIPRNAHR
jgi:RHS repeat-associated protein